MGLKFISQAFSLWYNHSQNRWLKLIFRFFYVKWHVSPNKNKRKKCYVQYYNFPNHYAERENTNDRFSLRRTIRQWECYFWGTHDHQHRSGSHLVQSLRSLDFPFDPFDSSPSVRFSFSWKISQFWWKRSNSVVFWRDISELQTLELFNRIRCNVKLENYDRGWLDLSENMWKMWHTKEPKLVSEEKFHIPI